MSSIASLIIFSSAVFDMVSILQSWHNLRSNLWAAATFKVEGIKYFSMPMSSKRGTTPKASLVCSVERTMWPVRAA